MNGESPLLDDDDELTRAEHLLADLGDAPATLDTATATGDGLGDLYSLSQEMLLTLDVRDLLPRILGVAMSVSQAERGVLFHFNEWGELSTSASSGIDTSNLQEAAEFSRTVVEQARSRIQILTQDTRRDAAYQDVESLQLKEIRSILCMPIANEDRVLGAIYLDNRGQGRRFSQHAVRVIGVLAGLSAVALQNAERYGALLRTNQQLSVELGRHIRFDEFIGRSRPVDEMLRTLERITATDFPVMLLGESGTGKELLSRAIHRGGRRATGPLVVQNCAAVPAELLESEFFGHTRGAFTGAHAAREGLFRRAQGGTLFLDEVAELDIRLQAKLLRVLEENVVRPVGSSDEFPVDFRLITATSVDMKKAVEEGRVRRDLYYRLNVVVVQIPPLRERSGDIPLLVSHFMEKHRQGAGQRELKFSRRALDLLQRLPWPGNVRELEHLVQRALVLVERPVVEEDDLARLLDARLDQATEIQLPVGHMSLAAMEEWAIREALRRTNGNKAQAAQVLGIHRNALLRRLEKLDGPAGSS